MTSKKIRVRPGTKVLLGIGLLLCVVTGCAVLSVKGTSDFDLAKQEILLRKIGHEVLLQAGDSTSRVLPVKKINEYQYQVRFEHQLSFQTDSLVKIIRRTLANDNVPDNYIVNVLNCSSKEVFFGYAAFSNEKDNIVPCSGRKQPAGCYIIDLKFQNHGLVTMQRGYLVGGASLFAFLGLMLVVPLKSRKRLIENNIASDDMITIGNTLFDAGNRQIIHSGIKTELTPKENKLLGIFAQSPNTIIERNRLQKEIWEDEGVIVGRSLDVFISKLRKKLENDPSIQLINIHGKGYKLQITDAG